jgi:hypothetical protein
MRSNVYNFYMEWRQITAPVDRDEGRRGGNLRNRSRQVYFRSVALGMRELGPDISDARDGDRLFWRRRLQILARHASAQWALGRPPFALGFLVNREGARGILSVRTPR